jgi:ABC-type multidrug transport system fused ATPase/permease subunit
MLVIAHRYTMMKEADYVYVMSEGRVIEHGTPGERHSSQLLLERGIMPEDPKGSG